MIMRMGFFILIFFAVGGCATGSRKQATQSQATVYEKSQKTYQQDSYSSDYGYEDTSTSDTYNSAKKTYSEPVVKLSNKEIQRALKKAGFYQGSIDGKIGPKTKEAIIKFQKASGIKADGIVGKKTSLELNKYLLR
jgi:hypothetical protein